MNPKSTSPRLRVLAVALTLATSPALAQVSHLSTLQTGAAGDPVALYDGLIVTYRSGTAERISTTAAATRLNSAMATTAVRSQWNARFGQAPPVLNRVRRLATGADLVRPVSKLSQEQLNSLMQALRADASVAHVEPNLMLKPIKATTKLILAPGQSPNDPNATVQWHMRAADGHAEYTEPNGSTVNFPNWGGINAIPAWQYGDGDGVVVAVIDTGITAHPDLDTSLADAGYDFISEGYVSGRASDGRAPGGWDLGDWTTEDKYLTANGGCTESSEQTDSSWHGTHVAGTISELTNNGVGMIGVAPKARVLPVRALGHCGGTTADIADAIIWASGGHVDGVPDNQYPAEVINMSLGGSGSCASDGVTAAAISGAIARGTTVVVAAGNDNSDSAAYTPASCPGVINVAATGITGKRAYYSNYGSNITVSAPGGGAYTNDDASTGTTVRAGYVWSTLNTGAHGPGEPTYAGYTGTSMASPHIAGVAALVISAAYTAGKAIPAPQQIREILTQTSNVFPVKPTLRIGAGIVDASKAVARAAGVAGGGEEANAVMLSRGQILAGQSAAQGGTQLFRIDVPANARNLQIRTLGGSGQVKMYVRATRAPSVDGSNADVSSVRAGTTQNMQTALPIADSYFIRLVGGIGGYRSISLTTAYSTN
ncbi:protease [Xanthomonas arboricola]|uniref:S8 family peptidase n=1 Tax=Xanthomonas arboricola TaxID=56448 RepID=UPI00061A2AFF|nr:S8 family peptidase [Xanthomonas arboricola]AKC80654.1 protease [Xanthomonas arboricola]